MRAAERNFSRKERPGIRTAYYRAQGKSAMGMDMLMFFEKPSDLRMRSTNPTVVQLHDRAQEKGAVGMGMLIFLEESRDLRMR